MSQTIGADTDEMLFSLITYQVKHCFVMYSEQFVGYPGKYITI